MKKYPKKAGEYYQRERERKRLIWKNRTEEQINEDRRKARERQKRCINIHNVYSNMFHYIPHLLILSICLKDKTMFTDMYTVMNCCCFKSTKGQFNAGLMFTLYWLWLKKLTYIVLSHAGNFSLAT